MFLHFWTYIIYTLSIHKVYIQTTYWFALTTSKSSKLRKTLNSLENSSKRGRLFRNKWPPFFNKWPPFDKGWPLSDNKRHQSVRCRLYVCWMYIICMFYVCMMYVQIKVNNLYTITYTIKHVCIKKNTI